MSAMAQLYVDQIIKGNWIFSRVADPWIEEVTALLIEKGREDLISAK